MNVCIGVISLDDKEYRKYLDKISPSFCGAKWFNATIWLGSGMTTSCHHPPAHKIPEGFVDNPKLIHNTPEKKADRAMMQKGERPKGCDYCWKIQDLGTDAVPDRVYKSKIFSNHDLEYASKTRPDQDINLQTLEISFDRTCNFACSYCNPEFSTTWVKDIKKNGPYKDLVSDGRNHFTHTHDSAQLYKVGETNPYVEAFFKWWDSDLKHSLDELRITGGEPTMSQDFWRLLDFIDAEAMKNAKEANPERHELYETALDRFFPTISMNSNLGCSDELFGKLLSYDGIDFGTLYTSCEGTGAQAEYIRDGLNYDEWFSRLDTLVSDSWFNDVSVMCTVNALCLWSLPEMLDHLVQLRKKYGAAVYERTPSFTLNILRFPSFQSCLVLPEELRKTRRQALQGWLLCQDPRWLHAHEIDHIDRLIDYLNEPEPEDIDKRRHDFKHFYKQYDKRRDKSFNDTFPSDLVEWFNSL